MSVDFSIEFYLHMNMCVCVPKILVSVTKLGSSFFGKSVSANYLFVVVLPPIFYLSLFEHEKKVCLRSSSSSLLPYYI